MSNDLMKIPTLEEIESMKGIAAIAKESNAFGIELTKKPGRMEMIMLTGMSFGISPVLAPNYIYEFNGKFGILTKTMLALIYQSGLVHSIEYEDIKDKAQKIVGRAVEMKRVNPNGDPLFYRAEFTMDDAKKAGLISQQKDNWEKYPLRMCEWRAVSWAATSLFPDIIGGMLSTEEIGMKHDKQGNPIIESTFEELPKYDANKAFQELATKYGQEALSLIGQFGAPQTEEDIEKMRITLEEKSNDSAS